MAGIYGFLDLTGRTNKPGTIAHLREAAKHDLDIPSSYTEFSHGAIGSTIPSHYSSTSWPLSSKDGLYALAVYGEIILPTGEPLRSHNFEEVFLRPFLQDGKEFIKTLDGAFILALMSERECMVINDQSGNFAIHYTSTNERFAFSTQMTALRHFATDRSFNERGLFEQLGISQSLDGRTLFHNIQRLTRGTILRFSEGKITLNEYISRQFHPSAEIRDELGEVYKALDHSVKRCTNYERVTAALSGGFDSRMTWSLLLANGLDSQIVASTHGLSGSRDVTVAKRITDKLGVQHKRIVFTNEIVNRLPTLWREFAMIVECLYPISQAFSHYVFPKLGNHFNILIDSYGGPLYRRQIKKFIEKRIDMDLELAPQVLPYELTALASSKLLKPEVREEIQRKSLEGLREYYARIEDITEVGDKFDMYYADQTVALRDSCLANHQMNYIGILQPLLDRKALDAVSRVPSHIRRREGIHKYVIHKAYPKLEEFSLDYSGYPAPYRGFSTFRLLGPAFDKAMKAAGQLIPKLSSLSLRRPPMDARTMLRPGLNLAKALLLSPHPLYDPIVDRSSVERTVNELGYGDYTQAQAIIQLLTFRLMLDIFL